MRLEEETESDHTIQLAHGGLRWVTLLRGEELFQGISVGKECQRLGLVKFRDFELREFNNPRKVRFWSEKNLLNDEHF